jgi:predicted nucleic-acid-binding protein
MPPSRGAHPGRDDCLHLWMIGLDTNIVVRYLTHDDAAQTAAAVRVIESLSQDSPGFLSLIVVVELVWVLEVAYRFKKNEIERVLETLLRSKELAIERAEIVWQALRKFTAGSADFADCLIERVGHAAECEYTVTFDKSAAGAAGMKLLH